MDIHVVRAGETVSSVAARYGVPAGILAGVNGVAPDAPLAVGQTLVTCHPRELHTVASGESVYSIALRYGLSVRTLYQNNPALGGRSALYPGRRSSSPTTTRPRARSPSTPTATPLSAAACSTPRCPISPTSRPLPTASTPTARCCRSRTNGCSPPPDSTARPRSCTSPRSRRRAASTTPAPRSSWRKRTRRTL